MKNKKVFKFQRKQILISNPLQPQQQQNPNHQPQPHHRQQKTQQQTSSQYTNYPQIQPNITDKLEIPKQLRLVNVVNKLKSQFVTMMEGDPIIKIDVLFQSQIVCQITGNVPKNNRESFGRGKDKSKLEDVNEGQLEQRIPIQQPNIFHQFCRSQPNYLDILQEGIPEQSLPLKQAFQRESNHLFQQNSSQGSWDPHQRNKKPKLFQQLNHSFEFANQQYDKRSKPTRNIYRRNQQKQGLERFQFS